eukprot:5893061-Alexandrium_andersonii.AAC.1
MSWLMARRMIPSRVTTCPLAESMMCTCRCASSKQAGGGPEPKGSPGRRGMGTQHTCKTSYPPPGQGATGPFSRHELDEARVHEPSLRK